MMNWPQIIEEIQSHGLTQKQIADAIGISQGYISDLKNGERGKRIGFAAAGKLIALRDNLTAGTPVSPAESSLTDL